MVNLTKEPSSICDSAAFLKLRLALCCNMPLLTMCCAMLKLTICTIACRIWLSLDSEVNWAANAKGAKVAATKRDNVVADLPKAG